VFNQAEQEDNVLIEYMLSICCLASEASHLSKVYPIFIGVRGKSEGSIASIGSLFADGLLAKLPDVVPTASIAAVMKLLPNGVKPMPGMEELTVTVKAIVNEMTK
jgi:hypothetical protein